METCAYMSRSARKLSFDRQTAKRQQFLDCGAELTRTKAKAQSYVLLDFQGNVMLLANRRRNCVDLRCAGGY
jgi:transcription initiation factor IIE alpha subunit